VVSELDSRLEGRVFESHRILDGNGVMPGLIPTPNPGSFNKIQVAKWSTPKFHFNGRRAESEIITAF